MNKRIKTLIDNLEQDKIVLISYTTNDGVVKRKLFKKIKKNFYNVKKQEFYLNSCLEDKAHTIPSKDLVYFVVYDKEPYSAEKIEEAKNYYNNLAEKYKTILQDTTLLELAHIIKHPHLMSKTKLMETIKNYVLMMLKETIQKEKNNITKEFQSYNKSTDTDVTDESELSYVLQFLDGIEADVSIFEEKESFEEIMKAWPVMLQPSPLVDLHQTLLSISEP